MRIDDPAAVRRRLVARLGMGEAQAGEAVAVVPLELSHSRQLQAIYGGDLEVISAVCIANMGGYGGPDATLGDGDASDRAIIQEELILGGFTAATADKAIAVLDELRTFGSREHSTEAQIAHDARALVGFSSYALMGEARRQWIDDKGVPGDERLVPESLGRQLAALEFAESRKHAARQLALAALLLTSAFATPILPSNPIRGKYIIMEGNSGTGKDTQAKLLTRRLEDSGRPAVCLSEPSEEFYLFARFWAERHGSTLTDKQSLLRRYMLIGDRSAQVGERILPALLAGTSVVSVRSFISTLVYQARDDRDRALIAYEHDFVPAPSLILLYDAEADLCLRRIASRGEVPGLFEKLEELRTFRRTYLHVCGSGVLACPVRILDASLSIQEVAERTWREVEAVWEDTYGT